MITDPPHVPYTYTAPRQSRSLSSEVGNARSLPAHPTSAGGRSLAVLASALAVVLTTLLVLPPAPGYGLRPMLAIAAIMLLPWLIGLLLAGIALHATRGWRLRDGSLASSAWNGFFVVFGWAAAAACASKVYGWLAESLRPALFGTVLETLPAMLAVVAAALTGLSAGLWLHGLPRRFAIARIQGRVPSAVARETLALGATWLLTLVLVAIAVWLRDPDQGLAIRQSAGLPPVMLSVADDLVIALASTAAYGLTRLAAYPFVAPGPGLWLVTPTDALHDRALIAADALTAEGTTGPVTLIAPASSPGRGEHLFVADRAGVLSALFPANDYELGGWSSALPMADRWQSLPHRELYPADKLLPRAVERFLGADDIVVMICADSRSLESWVGKLPAARTLIVAIGNAAPPEADRLSDFATVLAGSGKSEIRSACKGLIESRLRSPVYRRFRQAGEIAPQSPPAAASRDINITLTGQEVKAEAEPLEPAVQATDDALRIGIGVARPELSSAIDGLVEDLSRVPNCSMVRLDPSALNDVRALDRTLARLDVLILPFNNAPQMGPSLGNGHLRVQSQSWQRAGSAPERERRLLWLDLEDSAPAHSEATQDDMALLRSVRAIAMRRTEVIAAVRELARAARLFIFFAREDAKFVEPLSRRLQLVWKELIRRLDIGSPPVLQLRALRIDDASTRSVTAGGGSGCILLTGRRGKADALPMIQACRDRVRSARPWLIAQVSSPGEEVEHVTEVGSVAIRFELQSSELVEHSDSFRMLRSSLVQLLFRKSEDGGALVPPELDSRLLEGLLQQSVQRDEGTKIQSNATDFQSIAAEKFQRIRGALETAITGSRQGEISRVEISDDTKSRLRLMVADLLHSIGMSLIVPDWPYQFGVKTSTAIWQGFALQESDASGVQGYVACLLITPPETPERAAAIVSYVVDSERTPTGPHIGDVLCHVGPVELGVALELFSPIRPSRADA